MAAVITQLFSYMIDTKVRYGYICTGEAYVFLRILKDPTKVMSASTSPRGTMPRVWRTRWKGQRYRR